MTEEVILVDQEDRELGTMEKLEAHEKGLLHRAISVFIVNSKGEWLLQQRAQDKYHSGGLWTNTCCSHPLPGESSLQAAQRRLQEEMGMKTELKELFHFTYREAMNNELTEHELDHVFIGMSDAVPEINPSEVHDWKYLSFVEIQASAQESPDQFTLWFLKIMEKVNRSMQSKFI